MKKIVDNFVNSNFDRMLLLAKARAKQSNRNYDAGIIVSACYEYLIKNKDKVTEENVESIAFNFINMSAYWTNSGVNRLELLTQSPFRYNIEFKSFMLDIEDLSEVDELVNSEGWYAKRKSVISIYKESIKEDKIKHRFLEVMLREDKFSVRQLAEHFNISHTGAWNRVKEIKEELRKLLNKQS